MKVLPISELRRLSGTEMKDAAPIIVTIEGKEELILAGINDVIVINDLHPRLRNRFKAMEKRARIGMPAPIKVIAADVKAEV